MHYAAVMQWLCSIMHFPDCMFADICIGGGIHGLITKKVKINLRNPLTTVMTMV